MTCWGRRAKPSGEKSFSLRLIGRRILVCQSFTGLYFHHTGWRVKTVGEGYEVPEGICLARTLQKIKQDVVFRVENRKSKRIGENCE
ncbi:hypothetical protein TNCT_700881 [Trichonephila clavata]|uniref:Uncharacterized protein n=1 Tax=Trichonephila clavata TaxID=2740835 RepID=A0A8X6L3C5_TRICU|nr:hypothetical protein TNCT_700881 [Trichonephila clavata]